MPRDTVKVFQLDRSFRGLGLKCANCGIAFEPYENVVVYLREFYHATCFNQIKASERGEKK